MINILPSKTALHSILYPAITYVMKKGLFMMIDMRTIDHKKLMSK